MTPKQRDDNRDRSCARKIGYGKAEAKRVLDRLRSEGRTDLTKYHCQFCKRHHIGHYRGQGRRRKGGKP